jgi:hypothetical protein
MNVTRSKLVQVMAVSFVVIGLLVAAWPGVAQGELPQSKSPHNRYEEMRQLARQTNAAGSSTQSVSFPSAVSWASAYIQQEEYAGLGRGLSAAFDHNGRLHAAYSGTNDGILRYAHFKGSAWQIETVDSNTGDDTTLILDSTDRPNLLYTAGGNIKYAKFDGISWSIKTVISNTVQASLGLDSSDRPYISYYDESTADLKITYLAGESWHTELVDTSGDVGRYNRLRIDKPGQVHIAYCVYDPASTSCTKLKYASKVGTTWQTQIVDVGPSVGSGISLALDDGDHPHISYLSTAGGSGFDTALLYASHIGSSWQLRPVEYYQRDSLWTSIEVDRAGVPHISAAGLSGGAGQVFYAARTTGVWQVERPSDFYGGHHPVQLIDNRNQSVVVYYIYWGVLYATRTPDATDTYQLTYGSYRDNNWEVYSAQANGSTPVRRTYNPAYDSTPKFRRGANQIAFISNRDGNSEVYVMNADGTGVLRLTNTPANEYMPVWSPDGTKIAFYSYRDGNSEIYVMNANGSSQTRLTNNLSWDGHPDWSPNSQQIVFASNRDGSDELWIMNADGTNQHQVTFGLNAVYPSWSPDGNRIAFNDDTNNDGWLDIALINT